jgi:hypothetical protein
MDFFIRDKGAIEHDDFQWTAFRTGDQNIFLNEKMIVRTEGKLDRLQWLKMVTINKFGILFPQSQSDFNEFITGKMSK